MSQFRGNSGPKRIRHAAHSHTNWPRILNSQANSEASDARTTTCLERALFASCAIDVRTAVARAREKALEAIGAIAVVLALGAVGSRSDLLRTALDDRLDVTAWVCATTDLLAPETVRARMSKWIAGRTGRAFSGIPIPRAHGPSARRALDGDARGQDDTDDQGLRRRGTDHAHLPPPLSHRKRQQGRRECFLWPVSRARQFRFPLLRLPSNLAAGNPEFQSRS